MAILSAVMLTRDRGELLGFKADELVVGSRARTALGEPFGDPFGDPVPQRAARRQLDFISHKYAVQSTGSRTHGDAEQSLWRAVPKITS